MFRHTTMSDEQRQGLIDDHFLFRGKDSMQAASGYHEYWPEGRGVYHNTEKTFVNWLNEVRPACSQLHIVAMRRLRPCLCILHSAADGWLSQGDHLRIISMEQGAAARCPPKLWLCLLCPVAQPHNVAALQVATCWASSRGWRRARRRSRRAY